MTTTNETPNAKQAEFTVIERGETAAGKVFVVWRENRNGTFGVWALCENYAAHVRGGVSKSWRYCSRRQTESEARAAFARRVGAM